MERKGIVDDDDLDLGGRASNLSPSKPNLGVQHLLLRSPTDQRVGQPEKRRPNQQLQVPVILNDDDGATPEGYLHAVETPPASRRLHTEELDREAVASTLKDKLTTAILEKGKRRAAGPFGSPHSAEAVEVVAVEEEATTPTKATPEEEPPASLAMIDLEESPDEETIGESDCDEDEGGGVGLEEALLKVKPLAGNGLEVALCSWLTMLKESSSDVPNLSVEAAALAQRLAKMVFSILEDELPPLALRDQQYNLPKDLEVPVSNMVRTLLCALHLALQSSSDLLRKSILLAREEAEHLKLLQHEESRETAMESLSSGAVLSDLRALREARDRGVYLAGKLLTAKMEREIAALVEGISQKIDRHLAGRAFFSDLALKIQWEALGLLDANGSSEDKSSDVFRPTSSRQSGPSAPSSTLQLQHILDEVRAHSEVLKTGLQAVPSSSDGAFATARGVGSSALKFLAIADADASSRSMSVRADTKLEGKRGESQGCSEEHEQLSAAAAAVAAATPTAAPEKRVDFRPSGSQLRKHLLAAQVAARLALLDRDVSGSKLKQELAEIDEAAEALTAAISRATQISTNPDVAIEHARAQLEGPTETDGSCTRLSELREVLSHLNDPEIKRAALEAVAQEMREEAITKCKELKTHLESIEEKRRSQEDRLEEEKRFEQAARSICKLVSRRIPRVFEPSREELQRFCSVGDSCSRAVVDLLLNRAGLLLSRDGETLILHSRFWSDLSSSGAADGELAWASAQHWLAEARSTYDQGVFHFANIVLPILRPDCGWTLAVVRNIAACGHVEAPQKGKSPSVELFNLAQVSTLQQSQVLHLLRGFFAREWVEMGSDASVFDVEKLKVLRLTVTSASKPQTSDSKSSENSSTASAPTPASGVAARVGIGGGGAGEQQQLHSGLQVLEVTRRLLIFEGKSVSAEDLALPPVEMLKKQWQMIAAEVISTVDSTPKIDINELLEHYSELKAMLKKTEPVESAEPQAQAE